VAERDVDFVVLEELSTIPEFGDFVSALAIGRPIFGATVDAWHSLTDGSLGETDLLFVFDSNEGQRYALLIENKIDAPPQPQQAERYRKRGEHGKKQGLWDEYETVIMAPKRYLESARNSSGYGAVIPYEAVMAFFLSRRHGSARFGYKANVIREAIEQNRRGYQPVYSDEMTRFVEAYTRFVQGLAPELKVEPARPRPAGSTWILYRPDGYPKGAYLCHQMTAGHVKLFGLAKGQTEDQFRKFWEPRVGDDVRVEAVGGSLTLVIDTPGLNPRKGDLTGQIDAMRAAIAALQRLDELFRAGIAK
jgi:hypothetical protein